MDDIPTLRPLAETIWRAHYPGIISHAQIDYMLARMYAAEVIRREMDTGTTWALALADAEPIGFLSFSFDPNDRRVKLHKLYLLHDFHGRGYGWQMLQHVRAEAVRRGASQIHLQVNKQNTRAVHAYERAGFRITEAVVADIGGGFVMDDYLMALDLDGSRPIR